MIRHHCSPSSKDVRTAGVFRWTQVFASSEPFANPLMFLISCHREQALLIMLVMSVPVVLKTKSSHLIYENGRNERGRKEKKENK